jgi:hypothetical protein
MTVENKLYLKDGTLWDDKKSDEWVDDFLSKLDEASKDGKVIHHHRSIGELPDAESIKSALTRKKAAQKAPFTISLKYLPRILRRELQRA